MTGSGRRAEIHKPIDVDTLIWVRQRLMRLEVECAGRIICVFEFFPNDAIKPDFRLSHPSVSIPVPLAFMLGELEISNITAVVLVVVALVFIGILRWYRSRPTNGSAAEGLEARVNGQLP